jgi:hypothetical protein
MVGEKVLDKKYSAMYNYGNDIHNHFQHML